MKGFLKKINKFISSLFNRKSNVVCVEECEKLLEPRVFDEVLLAENRLIKHYNPNKPSIFIVDDSKGITSIIEEYLSQTIDTKNYNMLIFFGNNAGFVAIDTLNKLKNMGLTKIDYAIIDIILPGRVNTEHGVNKIDGIDISEILNKQFGCNDFIFFTGNAINYYVEYITEKSNKFTKVFNKSLSEYILSKNSTEETIIKKFRDLLSGSIHV